MVLYVNDFQIIYSYAIIVIFQNILWRNNPVKGLHQIIGGWAENRRPFLGSFMLRWKRGTAYSLIQCIHEVKLDFPMQKRTVLVNCCIVMQLGGVN